VYLEADVHGLTGRDTCFQLTGDDATGHVTKERLVGGVVEGSEGGREGGRQGGD